MSNAIMTSRQAAELDHAFERNGWTSEDVKWLSEGDNLSNVRTFLNGPEGGNIKIHTLTATVQQDKDWTESLESAGPGTPQNCDIRKVGHLYPPTSNKTEEGEYILLNFLKGDGTWNKVLKHAKSEGWEMTNPREVHAVAAQHDLRSILGIKGRMYLVSTTECRFEGDRQVVCVVLVDGSDSNTYLHGLGLFGDDGDWFLFRKSPKS